MPTGIGKSSSLTLESQLLLVGAAFVAFIALAAFFVTRRHRKLSREFSSPLITTSHGGALKSNGVKVGAPPASAFRKSLTPIQSPTLSDGTVSPQCVPLTPSYSSINVVQPAAQAQSSHIGHDRGTISVSLTYDPSSAALNIGIIKCENLPELVTSPNGGCLLDTYVKLRIMPENQHRMKTRIVKGNTSPYFDEIFTIYGIPANKLREHSLHIAVLAFDRYSKDTILGETIYQLGSTEDLINNNEKRSLTIPLHGRDEVSETRGEALISMAYNRQSNSINFALMKIKDLPKDSTVGLPDPYAKIYMLYNGQKLGRHKTATKKKTIDPTFNESFAFELPAGHTTHDLDKISFSVCVYNKSGVSRQEVIGMVNIDTDSEQWVSCRSQSGKQIAEWHRIMKYV